MFPRCWKTRKTGSARYQGSVMHRVHIYLYGDLLFLNDVIMSNVLFIYLFQENKSYGSKKTICIYPLVYKKIMSGTIFLHNL
jgi:hypothetical protein